MERQERLAASDQVDEMAPDVLRIQIPIMLPGLGHVNCYVLPDERGVTLVDPGLPDPMSNATLVERLGSVGIAPERVHTVLVTHSHPDHFGGAGRLRAEHHCDVVAHDSFATPFDPQPVDLELTEIPIATDGPATEGLADAGADVELPDMDGPVNRRFASVLFGTGDIPDFPVRETPYGEDGFRLPAEELEFMRSWDDLSKKGLLQLAPTTRVSDCEWMTIGGREWQALHTPGHTGDHLCLWDPASGLLLSGDHVLPTITPHISGLTPSDDALSDFFTALGRVAALPNVTTVLPAHGLPFSDLAGRVADIIEHHDERLERLIAIGDGIGLAGVRPYSHELFEERNWGPMAESETYAHLEHLRLLGKMDRSTDAEGRLVYRPHTA
ncbi:MAG: MBL fold metallo-hydrolase [Actinomycetia bacterium]|nr:MBL fold metallo-hydrolase [Actinomycetes bacterium]